MKTFKLGDKIKSTHDIAAFTGTIVGFGYIQNSGGTLYPVSIVKMDRELEVEICGCIQKISTIPVANEFLELSY